MIKVECSKKKKMFHFILIFCCCVQNIEMLNDSGYVNILNATWSSKDIIFGLNIAWNISARKCFDNLAGSGYNTAKYFASAVAIAVDQVNYKQPLANGYKLRYYWDEKITDTSCDDLHAVKSQLVQINKNVDAFIGYAVKCNTMAKNAASFNLPLLSMSCVEPELSNKEEYPTFARTTTLNMDVIHMIKATMDNFKWKKLAVLYEESHMWQPLFHALENRIKDSENKDFNEYEITLKESYTKKEAYKDGKIENLDSVFIKFLTELPKKAKIVWLLIEKGYLRQFLRLAEERGLNDGTYVYIAVHPFAASQSLLTMSPPSSNYLWILPWKGSGHTANDIFQNNRGLLTKIYKSVFVLMPEVVGPTGMNLKKYHHFQREVKDRMSQPPFNEKTYLGLQPITGLAKNLTKPPPEADRLYDTVMLYALGLNKTIQENGSVRDGAKIIQNMKGLTFRSIQGSRYIVNTNADIQQYFNLYQFQFTEDVMKKIVSKEFFDYKEPLFVPKKIFSISPYCPSNNCSELVFKMLPEVGNPAWMGGKTPLDEPECGFLGELCPEPESEKTTILAIAISVTFLVVIIIVIPVFLYRNYRLKRQLKSQLWKIDPSDLFFHDWRSVSTSSLGSLTSQTLSVSYETQSRQRFTSVAIYKGTLVAVKKMNKRNMEMNRAVLMELKQIRDVRHDNLNQFIGACVEPNNVLIITQYASKGSLQDVLENPEIHLDTLFILSLVYDIIKGMLYLHSTDIKSHGNLKSSNCVIDSRWVLKITDFGLNTFRSKQGTISSIETESCNSLLWKAPELLRLNIPTTSRGSQKGDVYSFGIILQECHTRDGAWGSSYQDAEAIIERVKVCKNPPFRPVVPELLDGAEALRDLMKKCWAENPEERPHFSELRKDVEVMMKANGLKTNIFDNMIYMMGKYSDDLEEIVEERTSSLIEEKHKVEALLERMLPGSVARQLMKGKEVEAESFEEVTIYFSDIVGFTTICSSISPMEVVNLLNNLYTMFDNVTKDYDVYKVETIGDAYMVVSGLPIRNGKQHTKEISLLALDILENVKSSVFLPNKEQLKIRIGIHCGPVVAGVVGTTMPRYCLFGDTVNVASRMESTGEALRIHISTSVQTALSSISGFHMEFKGLTTVKGKGNIKTFWLTGAESHLIRKRTTHHSDSYHHTNSHHTLKDILRDSPRLRHKLHLTPDYLPRPSTDDNLQKKLRINSTSSLKHARSKNKKRGGSKHHAKETTVELIDFSNGETASLLRNGNGVSPNGIHVLHERFLQNGSPLSIA